ncbi:MAG: hypothetical protein KatS3mg131_0753 [Candidatus Tectimicrobiota bacterium]|nr:MAG: hypothetical protein KatS3mg131_0753 [Candidatus Tectomicrobia bacterium]
MGTAYRQYLQLVARVEAFGEAIRARYPSQIVCQPGCDACCYQQLTVFPVEAYHLARAAAALPPAAKQQLRQHLQAAALPQWGEPQPCVLLRQGRCSLYAARPLLCRMHGFPLTSRLLGGRRDCCPLNFRELPLATLEPQAVYNLDVVNCTLVAINALFVREHGVSPQRVPIGEAVWQGLRHTAAAPLQPTDMAAAP